MFSQYPETKQFRHVCKRVFQHKFVESDKFPMLKFIGTVKVHGINAAIGYQKDYGHWFQSRHNIITPQSDKEGFAQSMESLAEQFFTECLLPQSRVLQEQYEQGRKIIIFGEWCGGTNQKNVAIYGLPKMFVIFKVLICDNMQITNDDGGEVENKEQLSKSSLWLPLKEWSHINWHEKRIFNIYDFPTYEINIDFQYPELSQNDLVNITEAVEKQCPVGTYFNQTGIGEGVVWTEWEHSCGDFKFKVKGQQHSVSKVTTLASVDVDKFGKIQEFIDYVCTENRLLQGLDYLREQHLTVELKNFGVFMRWLSNDIMKEENDTLEASGLRFRDFTRRVQKRVKNWFLSQSTC